MAGALFKSRCVVYFTAFETRFARVDTHLDVPMDVRRLHDRLRRVRRRDERADPVHSPGWVQRRRRLPRDGATWRHLPAEDGRVRQGYETDQLQEHDAHAQYQRGLWRTDGLVPVRAVACAGLSARVRQLRAGGRPPTASYVREGLLWRRVYKHNARKAWCERRNGSRAFLTCPSFLLS